MTGSRPPSISVLPRDAETIRSRPDMFVGYRDFKCADLAMARILLRAAVADWGCSDVVLSRGGGAWALDCAGRVPTPEESPKILVLEALAEHSTTGDENHRSRLSWQLSSKYFEHGPGVEGSRLLAGTARAIAAGFPGSRLVLVDLADGWTQTFHYQTAEQAVLELGGARSHQSGPYGLPWFMHDGTKERGVEAAIWWARDGGRQVYTVVNGYEPAHGGTHLAGFWDGLGAALMDRYEEAGHAAADLASVAWREIQWNCTLVLTLRWPHIRWGPATRCCVHDPEVLSFVATFARHELLQQLRHIPLDEPSPPWLKLSDPQLRTPWLSRLPGMVGLQPARSSGPDPK